MSSSTGTAEIKQDGKVIRTIDLTNTNEPYEFTVESNDGGHNTIRVENGRIAVIDADCDDKICVQQGYVSDASHPIVCLPHKLSITVTGNDGEYDAVVGGQG